MKKNLLILSLLAMAMPTFAAKTLQKPVVKRATEISNKGFTANWEPLQGVDGYCVFVYTKTPVTRDGEYTIVDEDFLGVDHGNVANPWGGEENYMLLDGYADTFGWSAYGFPRFITGMVDGLLYSPYLDLRADGGKYKVIISSYCSDGDSIRIESNGKNGKEISTYEAHVAGGGVGISTDTLEFSNGSKDLFFSVINQTAPLNLPGYFDRVEVKQNFKAGDEIVRMIASNESIDAETSWGEDAKFCKFASLPYKGDATVVYYDMYASVSDFSAPQGSKPYTNVYSPFSDLVKVDLANKTSEVEVTTGVQSVETEISDSGDVWYTLQGVRISAPTQAGIYIHNGKKVIVK